jgi:methanol---5-hydroxybenzimidazolylcobamide Co-methyltransferase
MTHFNRLSIERSEDLLFGVSPKPVRTRRGLVIGGGHVHPELNFTVPPMEIHDGTFAEIKAMYRDIVDEACRRSVELGSEGLVVEFETLVEMTRTPRYAIELTAVMNEVLESHYVRSGLKSALRITPNDLREFRRPPVLRSGELLDRMLETFAGCADAGAEMLSIESTGGKELHDPAILMCDIAQSVFALGVLAVRDMHFLWGRICDIAAGHGTFAGGDTACGFGNTAMVLAEKRNIPRVFAAAVRAATAARSLAAYEEGAKGPGKDCGYENVYLKAVTGFPMSMEGKSAACAHMSPVGNIASAACDLWSNESVQNIKLLGGMAPTVSLEQLVYDCRLMNRALESGEGLLLRDLLVESDAPLDPQALVLRPDHAITIAAAVAGAADGYQATKAAATTAVRLVREGYASGALRLDAPELPYLDRMEADLAALPDDEGRFIEQMLAQVDRSKFLPVEYGL